MTADELRFSTDPSHPSGFSGVSEALRNSQLAREHREDPQGSCGSHAMGPVGRRWDHMAEVYDVHVGQPFNFIYDVAWHDVVPCRELLTSHPECLAVGCFSIASS